MKSKERYLYKNIWKGDTTEMVKSDYEQIEKILNMVGTVADYVRRLDVKNYCNVIGDLTGEVSCAVGEINQKLLDSRTVDFCDMDYLEGKKTNYKDKEELSRQYLLWKNCMAECLERRYQAKNHWEEEFFKLMDRAAFVDSESMIEEAKRSLFLLNSGIIGKLCAYYSKLHYMWGTLDVDNDRYDVIVNRVKALKEHREDFIWLYNRLGDWRSKIVLTSMLHLWVSFDLDYVDIMKEANYTDYFDLDLVECGEQEVIVDLGTWTGDTIQNYITTYGKYRKIYCYEIDAPSMEEAKKNLSNFPNIEFRNKGAGSQNGRMFVGGSSLSSTTKIVETNTGREIEVVSLDSDIAEKVTMIKMDIEGGEQEALLGCVGHIREEKPKLLISVYHNNEDIWKIPRMIDDMNPDYRYYLRSNGNQWGPAEIVLFAL